MTEIKDFPIGEANWQSKREIVQEIPYPQFWSRELAQRWAKEIPVGLESEGTKTPLVELDLSQDGFGKIFIKNEGDQSVNPTGTMKDRMARACAGVYRDKARFYLETLANDPSYEEKLKTKYLPRFSIITAGNAGRALANAFEAFELPPPKLLLDKHVSPETLIKLKTMRADLYLTDLSSNAFTDMPAQESPLEPGQIMELTNNDAGFDLTSANQEDDPERPWRMFYYVLGEEIFLEQPNEIYDSYGSGATFEGLVDRQFLLDTSDESEIANQIKSESFRVGNVKILGAEPESFPSIADKLAAPVKPYIHYDTNRLTSLKQDGYTHLETGVYKVSEAEIKEAYDLLKKKGEPLGIATEPSAAAGLALYMKRWREGLVAKNSKVIVINTGRGALAETN